MPVSLSEWRARVGTFLPRPPTTHAIDIIIWLLLLWLLQTKRESLDEEWDQDRYGSTSSGNQDRPTSSYQSSENNKQRKAFTPSNVSSSTCLHLRLSTSPVIRIVALFICLLLLRAGDVEINPGPNEGNERPEIGIADELLYDIAKSIPNEWDKMFPLGFALQINSSSIKTFVETNHSHGTVTSQGTHRMLMDWQERTSITDQRSKLRAALVKANLTSIADRYIPSDADEMNSNQIHPGSLGSTSRSGNSLYNYRQHQTDQSQLCTSLSTKLVIQSNEPSEQHAIQPPLDTYRPSTSYIRPMPQQSNNPCHQYNDTPSRSDPNIIPDTPTEGDLILHPPSHFFMLPSNPGNQGNVAPSSFPTTPSTNVVPSTSGAYASGAIPKLKHTYRNPNEVQAIRNMPPTTVSHDPRQNIPPMTDAQMTNFQEELKNFYAIKMCQIKTNPLDISSLVDLAEVYTNLKLITEKAKVNGKNILKYEDILHVKISNQPAKKILFQGEAGVGKTTFVSKIAWDWVNGNHFREFKLVVLILFRDIQTGHTVGQILKSYLSNENDITSEQLDGYIRTHQHEVLIVMDGLDELASGMDGPIIDIINCNQYQLCRVLVTTRPSSVHEIKYMSEQLCKQYVFVEIKGFTRENVRTYIQKFFSNNDEAKDSLLTFMKKGSAVADTMSPFPIFCAMLCHMWQDINRRVVMNTLQTFSQFIREMVGSLADHYVAKTMNGTHNEEKENVLRNTVQTGFMDISEIAFSGLLEERLVFTDDEFDERKDALDIGCKVGVLSEQKKMTFMTNDGRTGKRRKLQSSISFPHKLLQEYIAGFFLASLIKDNPVKYAKHMDNIIRKITHFRYLLYFTVSQGDEVAKDILIRLSKRKGKGSLNICMDIALESQNKEAVAILGTSVKYTCLTVTRDMHSHVLAGYLYTLKHVVALEIMKLTVGETEARSLADFVIESTSLRILALNALCNDDHTSQLTPGERSRFSQSRGTMKIDDVFFKTLTERGQHCKIESLHMNLSPSESTSQRLGHIISLMPCLKTVKLSGELHDEFFSTISEHEPPTKIESLDINFETLSESASRCLGHIISFMPCLKTVKLSGELHDGFFSAMSEHEPAKKIESFFLRGSTLRRSGLSTIGSLPNLRYLTLIDITVNEGDLALMNDNGAHDLGLDRHPLTELTIDDVSLPGLHDIGLFEMWACPERVKLVLRSHARSFNTLNNLTLPGLTDLCLQGARYCLIDDGQSLINALTGCYVNLVTFSITDIKPHNERSYTIPWNEGSYYTNDIIRSLQSHPKLKNVSIKRCDALFEKVDDDLVQQINNEGRMKITVEHGPPKLGPKEYW